MKLYKKLAILPLALVISMPAYAHQSYSDSRFDQRLEKQHERIKAGVKSGQLTRKETRKLKKQQKKISSLERKFLADGFLSRYERKKLKKKQDKASQKIRKLKHNNRYEKRHGYAKPAYGHDYDRHVYRGLRESGWFVLFNLNDYF
ncbi:MAG: hypothetical protein P8Y20_04770 [Gammaproteobacteria bacterium]|jgi:phage/plasmid-associated DNA primase